ncbi:MAG TPA: hypothetical protein VLK58_07785 [Conexibacter sp.]|nr:hypothetical protein [Conexibacter sp.]
MGVLLVSWSLGFVVALATALLVKIDLGPLIVIPAATALATAGWWRRTRPPLQVAASLPTQQGFWPSKDPADYRGRGGGISGPPVPALPYVIGLSAGPLLSWVFMTSGYSPLALAAGFALLTIAVGAAIAWRARRG